MSNLIILFIIGLIPVAYMWSKKGRSIYWSIFWSFLLTPLGALAITLFLENKKKQKARVLKFEQTIVIEKMKALGQNKETSETLLETKSIGE